MTQKAAIEDEPSYPMGWLEIMWLSHGATKPDTANAPLSALPISYPVHMTRKFAIETNYKFSDLCSNFFLLGTSRHKKTTGLLEVFLPNTSRAAALLIALRASS